MDMKRTILLPMLLSPGIAAAHDHDYDHDHHHPRIVYAASDLLALCRRETEARYVGLGEQVYQWTGAYHDYANTLYADGKLRVSARDVEVHCRIPRNARERYLTMEIVDPAR